MKSHSHAPQNTEAEDMFLRIPASATLDRQRQEYRERLLCRSIDGQEEAIIGRYSFQRLDAVNAMVRYAETERSKRIVVATGGADALPLDEQTVEILKRISATTQLLVHILSTQGDDENAVWSRVADMVPHSEKFFIPGYPSHMPHFLTVEPHAVLHVAKAPLADNPRTDWLREFPMTVNFGYKQGVDHLLHRVGFLPGR